MSWLRYQFHYAPVTSSLMAFTLVSWLFSIYAVGAGLNVAYLAHPDLMLAPWAALTYVAFNPIGPLALFLELYFLWWVAGSLERSWGSRKLLGFFVTFAVLGKVSMFLGLLSLGVTSPLGIGMVFPGAAMLIAWTVLNPGATIMLMFILPVPAIVFRWLTLALTFFGAGHLMLGLFAIAPLLLAWWYTARFPGRGISHTRTARAKRGRGPFNRPKLVALPDRRTSGPATLAPPASPLEEEIDRILDKVGSEGLGALTPEEKARLDAHSVRLRDRD